MAWRTIVALAAALAAAGDASAASGESVEQFYSGKRIDPVVGSNAGTVQGGYASSTPIQLAMEKGEVDGRCGLAYDQLASRCEHWLKQKQVFILSQVALKKHSGRPFFAPADVTAERIAALRKALVAAANDLKLLADAKNSDIPVTSMPGEEMEQFVEQINRTPNQVVERAKRLVEGP